MNRKVVIEYKAAANEDCIHSAGVGGTSDVVTRVVWKQIEVNRTYMFCDCSAPSPLPPDYWRTFPLDERLTVVDGVYLPLQFGEPATSDLFYSFEYNADDSETTDPGWGEVSGVTTPSGASSAYTYEYDGEHESLVPLFILSNGVATKTLLYALEYDGSTTQTSEEWAYDRTGVDTVTSASMTGPDGAVTAEHYADGNSLVAGEVYKAVGPDGTISEKLFSGNSPGATAIGARANRYVEFEFVSPRDAGGSYTKTAVKGYVRDKNGNVTEVAEYDYAAYGSVPRDGSGRPTGPASGATPVRITKTAYYNDTPSAASTTYNDADSYHVASSPRLLGLAKSVEVQTGGGTPKSRSEMAYDYTSYSSNSIGGNLLTTKNWDSFKGGSAQSYSNPLTSTNSITTSATYNAYGMPVTTTDANNIGTEITYGSINGYADLYPTQTTVAVGTSVARTTTAAYDFYTGLVTSTTDEDNDVTASTEYDDLGRPTKVIAADNTLLESWTQTEYHDADRYVVVKSDIETKGDGRKVVIQHYDQLGRVRLSRTLEDASTEDPDDETAGIKVQTRYKAVSGYTYQLASNPYRAATSTAETDTTMGWTRSKAWANGSQSQVETFSGSGLPAPWGNNSTSTGVVTTNIDAERTLVTDQAGKHRISRTNALGQLKDIWEIMSASDSATESVTFPNTSIAYGYKTSYSYDTLNNLTTVNQGSQQRDFTYSSISRLRTAANPESGTINYGYDPNGNLTKKKDARNVETNYTYDQLNRITERSYTTPNPTPSPSQYQHSPTVIYTYGTRAPKVGKLTKVESSVSTTEYTSFDILGRVTGHKQTTDGTAYTTGCSLQSRRGVYRGGLSERTSREECPR